MTRRTTRTLSMILVLATAFLSSGIAMAQGFGPRGGGSFLPPQRVLENLGLTEEQSGQIDLLREELRITLGSFQEERRNLHEQLQAELQLEAPDHTVVGGLVISGRDLGEQIRATQQNFRETFQSILTSEQLEALKEMRNTRRHRRRGFGQDSGGFSNGGF